MLSLLVIPGMLLLGFFLSYLFTRRKKHENTLWNQSYTFFQEHKQNRKTWLKKIQFGPFTFIYSWVFLLRMYIDPFYILFLSFFKIRYGERMIPRIITNYFIDWYVVLLAFGSFACTLAETRGPFLTGLFLWRLMSIFVIRVDELLFLKSDGPTMDSLPRTMVFGIINLFEVSLAYAYLYTLPGIDVFHGRRMDALVKTMKVFTTWGPDTGNLCTIQGLLVLSQVVFAFVFLLFFITNIASFRYKNK